MSYAVVAGQLTPQDGGFDNVEDALNKAADHMRTGQEAVAAVVDESSGEVHVVLHNNYAFLAAPEE